MCSMRKVQHLADNRGASFSSSSTSSLSSTGDEDDDNKEYQINIFGTTQSSRPRLLDHSYGKPQILLMGLRGSGKSSIVKVVFHQMPPHETLFLETTKFVINDDVSWSSFVHFNVHDFPGQMDALDQMMDVKQTFTKCGALIFVIDCQDDYMEALRKLSRTIHVAYSFNTLIKFEIFIHKTDGLSEDQKIECQRDIHQRVTEDLSDLPQINISFYLSTIYDHSIFEAFSKVVQKLIPRLPLLENLLNVLISNCDIEKAFLFDVISKIYLATDSAPVDMQTYELCCDMIRMVLNFSLIYGTDSIGPTLDENSQSTITLSNNNVLWLRQVNSYAVLVCLMNEDVIMNRRGLIEHNFQQFKRGLDEILKIEEQERRETFKRCRKLLRQQKHQKQQQQQDDQQVETDPRNQKT